MPRIASVGAACFWAGALLASLPFGTEAADGYGWRQLVAFALAAASAVAIFYGLLRRAAWAFDVALASSLGVLVLPQVSLDDPLAAAIFLVPGAIMVAAHSILILSTRSGAAPGVVRTAMPRITVTVAVAAMAALFIVQVPTRLAYMVSPRWAASVDKSSLAVLVAMGLAFLAVGTFVTLMRLGLVGGRRPRPSKDGTAEAGES